MSTFSNNAKATDFDTSFADPLVWIHHHWKNQLWQCLLLIQTAHKSKLREPPTSLSLFTYYPHRNNGVIHHHLTFRDTSRIGLMYQIQSSCYKTHNQPTPGSFRVPKCFWLKGLTHYAVSSVNPLFHTHIHTDTNERVLSTQGASENTSHK